MNEDLEETISRINGRRYAEEESDQEFASRWTEAWDLLERHGIVGPEDRGMTLAELERLASYLPEQD